LALQVQLKALFFSRSSNSTHKLAYKLWSISTQRRYVLTTTTMTQRN